MKKIISLFKRDYDGDRLIRDEVVEGSEWVVNGEGIATVKIDGTSCLVKDGALYKRYDAKRGKTPPPDFIPAQDPDEITGHHPGWVPVTDAPQDQWHRSVSIEDLENGTYELIGEKIQGNPYGLVGHYLVLHGAWMFSDPPPRTFSELREWFRINFVEGIVWHHPDGRMCKVKRRDFGLPWPCPENVIAAEK
jgi:hypothetical protein